MYLHVVQAVIYNYALNTRPVNSFRLRSKGRCRKQRFSKQGFFRFSSRDRKAASCDFKYFCEDIEPVSLIWTKVDEAMLSSTSDDSHDSFEDSDINDLEDLDEMSTIEVMSHCNPCPSSSSSSSQQKSCSFGSFNQRKDDLELTQPLSKMKQTDEISIPLSESYC